MDDLKELRAIWKSNSIWDNIRWLGGICSLVVLIPYFLIFGNKENE